MKSLNKLVLATAVLISLSSTSVWAAFYMWDPEGHVVETKPVLMSMPNVTYETVTTTYGTSAKVYEWPADVANFTLDTAKAVTTILPNRRYVIVR